MTQEHAQQILTTCEQELAELERRRPLLVDAIAAWRRLVGTPAPASAAKPVRTKTVARALRPSVRPSVRPSPAARSLPDKPSGPPKPGGRIETVTARDQSIVTALKKGPAPSAGLVHVLPKEPGQTADQREAALRNALTRLQAKKQITQTDDGWALVG